MNIKTYGKLQRHIEKNECQNINRYFCLYRFKIKHTVGIGTTFRIKKSSEYRQYIMMQKEWYSMTLIKGPWKRRTELWPHFWWHRWAGTSSVQRWIFSWRTHWPPLICPWGDLQTCGRPCSLNPHSPKSCQPARENIQIIDKAPYFFSFNIQWKKF